MYTPVQVKKTTIYLNFTAEKQDSEGKQPLRTSVLNTGCPPTFRTHRRGGGGYKWEWIFSKGLSYQWVPCFSNDTGICDNLTLTISPRVCFHLVFLPRRERGFQRPVEVHKPPPHSLPGLLVFSSWPVATVEPLGFTHSLAKRKKKWWVTRPLILCSKERDYNHSHPPLPPHPSRFRKLGTPESRAHPH